MSVLAEKRKDNDLTQPQLASLIYHKNGEPISKQTVSNWENLKRTPDPYEMKQASEILGCPVEELFKEFFLGVAK